MADKAYVSTLLEILAASNGFRASFDILFQPFLRFWLYSLLCAPCKRSAQGFQPFLRFYPADIEVGWPEVFV